jgi:hypothetical protein
VNPRAGLDYMEKLKFLTLLELELLPLGRPVHSESLYRLRGILLDVYKVVVMSMTGCTSSGRCRLLEKLANQAGCDSLPVYTVSSCGIQFSRNSRM